MVQVKYKYITKTRVFVLNKNICTIIFHGVRCHCTFLLGFCVTCVFVLLCFSAKDYDNAIKYYTEALELNPSNAIYYSNRSLAYLRTECYGYALADATKALEIDKNYIKGYYRRATSNMALGKFKAALKDYETVRDSSVNIENRVLATTNRVLGCLSFHIQNKTALPLCCHVRLFTPHLDPGYFNLVTASASMISKCTHTYNSCFGVYTALYCPNLVRQL